MTRLPWQHTRNRTKSGSDRAHLNNTQDWFSRTAEPSRQALTELVKAHKRERSDGSGSGSSRSRSRSTTVTSVDWQQAQSRKGSTSEDAAPAFQTTRTPREGSIYSTLDRKEGAAKAFLAKGNMMLRRTGSKMSLSSTGSGSTLGFTSPSRGNSSGMSSTEGPSTDDIRGKISAPFDFQHITHTEQTQFVGLGRIEESELAHRFSAIAHDQPAAFRLKGIEASDIHEHSAHDIASTQPTTPPRPTPPPKDCPPHSCMIASSLGSPLRSTHPSTQYPSFEPLPFVDTSFTTADGVPPIDTRSQTPPLIHSAELESKPLPHLPVIHAVTTDDNTARAMIVAPLPTPPGSRSPASNNDYFGRRMPHVRQKSSVAVPRHMSLYPATKTSMPNLVSTNHLAVAQKALPRHRSDMGLSQQARDSAPAPCMRTSMSFGAIDVMNWEDAVDEAWDVVDEPLDSGYESSLQTSFGSTYTSASDDDRSAVSTPLMMAPSRKLPCLPSERVSPVVGMEVRKLESVQEDEPQVSLSGLGISSCPSTKAATPASCSRSSSMNLPRRSNSQNYGSNGVLTRSSSQESIILSIASSIVGTQRSSSSSVVADDLLRQAQDLDLTKSFENEHGFLEDTKSINARPESGCLPPDIVQQLSLCAATADQKEAVPPVPQLPTVHKHSRSAPRVVVPERRSSIVAAEHSKQFRKRSHTLGARPPPSTRISSYSLFPKSVFPPAITS